MDSRKARTVVMAACVFFGTFFTSMSAVADDEVYKPSHLMASLGAATIALYGHVSGVRTSDPWRAPNERREDPPKAE